MTTASATIDRATSAVGIPPPIVPEPPDMAATAPGTPTNDDPTDPVPTPEPPLGPPLGPPPSTGGWPAIAEYARELGPDPACEHLSDEQVEVELRRSAGAVASATARFLVLVAEHVVRGRWSEAGMTTPGQWLSWAVGMAPSTGREMVRVALALRTFTRVRDRFLAGTISYSKVRAITRVGEPALEDTLLTFADNAPASQLERVVRTFRGLDARESAHDRRGVTIRHLESGDVELRVRVPRETGLRAASQLERLMCELDDAGHPDDAQLAPDRRELDDHPPPQRDPIAARRADALMHGLAIAVDHLDHDLTGADRTTLVLHGEVDTVVDGLANPGTSPHAPNPSASAEASVPPASAEAALSTGPPSADSRHELPTHHGHEGSATAVTTDDGGMVALSQRVLRRLSCDPSITRITTRSGLPIDVGRQTRQISIALRRALRVRDETCRHPGCAATRHLHAHHVVHWADGGPTDLANLVLLCGAHHRLVHRHDLLVAHDPDTGHTTVTKPGDDGPIPSVLTPIGTGHAASAEAAGRHDTGALEPRSWWGDRLDLDAAVAHLQHQIGRIPDLATAA